MLFHFACFIVLTIVGCSADNLKTIKASDSSGLREVQLGESDYYVDIAPSIKLNESKGKEGQLGCNFQLNDTAFAFIEIEKGEPVNEGRGNSKAKPYAKSICFGEEIIWKSYQTSTGYFNANAEVTKQISLGSVAKNEKDFDLLISLLLTLHKK